MKFYITTAIDYVNAPPHVGHAYEKITADVIARYKRLKGDNVYFLTGTDENAQKNAEAAKEAGIETRKFIDKNVSKFKELCKELNITNDYFVRTTEKRHIEVTQEILKRIHKNGDIYKDNYSGLYCSGCEEYKTERELIDGKCPEHNIKPELLEEESYFFKLSKYQDKMLELLNKDNFVIPKSRRNEMISRIKKDGLKDLSISRKNVDWGIEVPFDKEHKIYVWVDALINYVSALDYPKGNNFKTYWPADIHFIGKGINWFHSVIWPSLLISAKIKVPKTILVHGYITFNGKKISKSLGNAINPLELLKKYPLDGIRYFLIREISFGEDGDFSEEALKNRINNELANDLGNLVSRTSAMVEKYFNGKIPKGKNQLKFDIKKVEKLMDNYDLTNALNEIWSYVNEINKYINKEKPWEKENKEEVLYTILDSIRIVSILLFPFIPDTCEKISKQLNFEIKSLKDCKVNLLKQGKIKKGKILFKKIE